MDVQSFLMRMFSPDKWREQQAQKLSSGLGSMPYSFDETMDIKYPMLMDMFRRADANDEKRSKIFDSLTNGLGQPPTTNFLDYYRQKEMIDGRNKQLQNLFKGLIV